MKKRDELPNQGAAQTRAIILYSGGKDSNLALYCAIKNRVEVECLLSMIPETSESWLFHYPNAEWTALQANAMEISALQVSVSGVAEEELTELDSSISFLRDALKIDSLISGVIESNYQMSRLKSICGMNELRLITPLWKRNPAKLIEEMLDLGFEIRFVGVSALGLEKDWLGRSLDRDALRDLTRLSSRHGFHLAGEGGEYETFVCDSPLFKQRIEIIEAEEEWSGDSGILRIKEARLVEKDPLFSSHE